MVILAARLHNAQTTRLKISLVGRLGVAFGSLFVARNRQFVDVLEFAQQIHLIGRRCDSVAGGVA